LPYAPVDASLHQHTRDSQTLETSQREPPVMDSDITRRVHVVPFGVERDRILVPVREYAADDVVLLDYLSEPAPARPSVEDLVAVFDDQGVSYDLRDVQIDDPFDALAEVGQAIADYRDDDVFVNLATGDTPVGIGAMMACMTTGARPYYVTARQHGSHQGPVPTDVESIESMPSYPLERPTDEQLAVMQHIATSERTNREGEPYRKKSDLITFGEVAELPFLADFDGETAQGKFRRLQRYIVDPLTDKDFITIVEVGVNKQVFLTDDGRNTLRAFQHLLD
jgi:hypothetical protein